MRRLRDQRNHKGQQRSEPTLLPYGNVSCPSASVFTCVCSAVLDAPDGSTGERDPPNQGLTRWSEVVRTALLLFHLFLDRSQCGPEIRHTEPLVAVCEDRQTCRGVKQTTRNPKNKSRKEKKHTHDFRVKTSASHTLRDYIRSRCEQRFSRASLPMRPCRAATESVAFKVGHASTSRIVLICNVHDGSWVRLYAYSSAMQNDGTAVMINRPFELPCPSFRSGIVRGGHSHTGNAMNQTEAASCIFFHM